MTAVRTPEQDRIARRVMTARSLGAAMLRHCAVNVIAAAHIGVSESRFRQWLDAGASATISFADVLALPPLVRRDLAVMLAGICGCELVDSHEPGGTARIAALAHRAGDAMSTMAQAIADGIVSRAEADELERAAAALSAEAQSLVALARKARIEGVATVGA